MSKEPKDRSAPEQSQSADMQRQETQNPEVSNLTPDSQDVKDQEIDSPGKHSDASQAEDPTSSRGLSHDESICRDIKAFQAQLAELLSWKEDLKLYSLGANINLAYYDLWRSDADLLFQRCVILRKRLQKYARGPSAP